MARYGLSAAVFAAIALTGCGDGGPVAPEAETVGEKRALDDAAEMLKQQRYPAALPSATASADAP